MKKLKVIIVYTCLGVLSLVAEDTIFVHPNDMLSLQCVQQDTLSVEVDTTSTMTHVSVDFNDKTPQNYLIEILSVLAALVVPIGSYIWIYKTNEQNNQHLVEQAQREYKRRMNEKYHDECVKKQGEILSKLNEIVGDICNGMLPESIKVQNTTNIIIASVPYLTDRMYEIASDIISIIEKAANETNISTDNTTKLNQLIGDYVSEYKENVRVKNKTNNNI